MCLYAREEFLPPFKDIAGIRDTGPQVAGAWHAEIAAESRESPSGADISNVLLEWLPRVVFTASLVGVNETVMFSGAACH